MSTKEYSEKLSPPVFTFTLDIYGIKLFILFVDTYLLFRLKHNVQQIQAHISGPGNTLNRKHYFLSVGGSVRWVFPAAIYQERQNVYHEKSCGGTGVATFLIPIFATHSGVTKCIIAFSTREFRNVDWFVSFLWVFGPYSWRSDHGSMKRVIWGLTRENRRSRQPVKGEDRNDHPMTKGFSGVPNNVSFGILS